MSDEDDEERKLEEEVSMLEIQYKTRLAMQEAVGASEEDLLENDMLDEQLKEATERVQQMKAEKQRLIERDTAKKRVEAMNPGSAAIMIQALARGVKARQHVLRLRLARVKAMSLGAEGDGHRRDSQAAQSSDGVSASRAGSEAAPQDHVKQAPTAKERKEMTQREKAAIKIQARARGNSLRKRQLSAQKQAAPRLSEEARRADEARETGPATAKEAAEQNFRSLPTVAPSKAGRAAESPDEPLPDPPRRQLPKDKPLKAQGSSTALSSVESFKRWGEKHLRDSANIQKTPQERAARAIQAGARGMRDRRAVKAEKTRVVAAATKIQARTRGILARKQHPRGRGPEDGRRFSILGEERVAGGDGAEEEEEEEEERYSDDDFEEAPHVAVPSAPEFGQLAGGEMVEEQIGLLDEEWRAVPRRRRILQYACRLMAESIVCELADAVVDAHEAREAREAAAEARRAAEEGCGYRKMRSTELRNLETLRRVQGELDAEEARADRARVEAAERARGVRARHRAEREAERAAAQEREAERYAELERKAREAAERKAAQQEEARHAVEALKRSRRAQSEEMQRFLAERLSDKLVGEQEGARAELLVDAQRKRQAVKAARHARRAAEERALLQSLADKQAARRRVRERTLEAQFLRTKQRLEERRDEERRRRGEKRLAMMRVWQAALDASTQAPPPPY